MAAAASSSPSWGCHVVGIDVNDKWLRLAEANARDEAECEFIKCDASTYTARAQLAERGPFDLIIINDVFEHIYDTAGLLTNVRAVMSPDALFYYKVPNGWATRSVLSEGLHYEFHTGAAGYLVEPGNSGNFSRPQPSRALELDGAFRLRLQLMQADGEFTAGCGLYVMFCNAGNQIVDKRNLPLGVAGKEQATIMLRPEVTIACIAVRLTGSGRLGRLWLRATVMPAQPDLAGLRREDFLITAESSSESTDWLDEVPTGLRVSLANDILDAQQFALIRLRAQLAHDEPAPAPVTPEALLARALEAFRQQGLRAAFRRLTAEAPVATTLSRVLEDLAVALEPSDRDAALRGFWFAYAARPGPRKARKLALKMFRSGNITSADALLRIGLQADLPVLGHQLRLAAKVLQQPPEVPPAPRKAARPVAAPRIAYVAAAALPLVVSGYTTRTHQLLIGMRRAGHQVRCYVRPGFPWDRPAVNRPEGEVPPVRTLDEVQYHYALIDRQERTQDIVERTADALEAQFRSYRPHTCKRRPTTAMPCPRSSPPAGSAPASSTRSADCGS